MEHICQYCSKPFLPRRTDSRYCSHSCRQLAYVLRKVSVDHPSKEENELSEVNYPSNEFLQNNQEIIKKPVSEQEANEIFVNSDVKELSVKTVKQASIAKSEPEYEEYDSRFMQELCELHEKSDSWPGLNELFARKDLHCIWISERFRCLIECLLTLSEMKSVDLNDLKELCNAFTYMNRSKHFEELSESYPYIEDLLELRELLKSTCINAGDNEQVRFKLSRNQKQNLILTRYELSEFTPRKSFNDLF